MNITEIIAEELSRAATGGGSERSAAIRGAIERLVEDCYVPDLDADDVYEIARCEAYDKVWEESWCAVEDRVADYTADALHNATYPLEERLDELEVCLRDLESDTDLAGVPDRGYDQIVAVLNHLNARINLIHDHLKETP